MENVTVNPTITGYEFTFGENMVIKVSRLDVRSDGRVTGDIEILNSDKNNPILLMPSTQFNFSSEPTRAKYAKQLANKYPDIEVNWTEIFDYLGYEAQHLAREGEPAEEAYALDEIPQLDYMVKPLIIRGQPNIIFGSKGVNKSSLAYTLGAILCLPWRDNPLELEVCNYPVKTLVLDWETDRQTFDYYITRIKKGMDIPSFSLFYRRCRLPLTEDIDAIQHIVESNNIELLIIDSLAAAAGGEYSELKGSSSAISFNSALRKLRKTSLIIAQTSKDANTQVKTIYGSVIFTYYSRNILELCRSDSDGNVVHLGLFHRESNLDRKYPPMGIRVTYGEDGSITMEREPLSVDDFMQKVTLETKIIHELKGGAKSAKELSDELDVKPAVIRTTLNRLKRIDKVVKVGEKWGIPLTIV